MEKYHKINTVFKRNPETNFKTLLENNYSMLEFEYLAKNKWVFTEKVDGTNIRVLFDGELITFRGKTDKAQMPSELVLQLSKLFLYQFDLFKYMFNQNKVCFYGEGYGAKIQSGGKYSQNQNFVLFDIKVGNIWLRRQDVESIAESFRIDIVPIVGEGTLKDMVEKTKKGFNSTWGNFEAEGIVARPLVELCTRGGERIITKIKCKDFNK